MALTPSNIVRGRSNVSEIIKDIRIVNETIESLIQKLLADKDFEKFCFETPLGQSVFDQLQQLQGIVTSQVVGGITAVADVTRTFLDNQEALNAGGNISGSQTVSKNILERRN